MRPRSDPPSSRGAGCVIVGKTRGSPLSHDYQARLGGLIGPMMDDLPRHLLDGVGVLAIVPDRIEAGSKGQRGQ